MAFHPYPQVIRAVFNPHRFGPPLGVTPASPCSWVDRPGFGSTPGNSVALVTGLAFAAAPLATSLASHVSSNSPDHNAKGTQSGHAPAEAEAFPPTACRHVVSGALSLPAQGCFSPVPHGTRPLSVTRESLALEGGPPSFAPGFSFRALLRNTATTESRVRLPGSHRLWPPVPGKFTSLAPSRPQVLQPRAHKEHGLGLGPFRSPLLRTSRLISLPPGTEMFQFPGFAFRPKTE